MPPGITFAKEDVIEAAFRIASREGLKDLSARKVAEELGSSTAPVYSCFASMDDLKLAVLERAEKAMLEYAFEPYTKSVFLNMGTGLSLFARDNKNLYRAMFLEDNDSQAIFKKFLKTLSAEVIKDKLIAGIPAAERNEVFRRMAVFTHGFASLICVGIEKRSDKKFIITTMYDMGKDIIDYALIKSEQNKNFNKR